jgi:hypothetical protein
MKFFAVFKESWNMYTPKERRNIAIYIMRIMLYKSGLDAFNGSIVTVATDRFKATNNAMSSYRRKNLL